MSKYARRTTAAIAVAAAVTVTGSATAIHAAGVSADSTNLRAAWITGGRAELELEDRNVEPAVCFIWENDAPQDGDSIASRILTRTGAVVVNLGTGDQFIDGSASACEIPRNGRYRDVFTNPEDYIVEFEVIENQGTPRTGPVRSGPLEPASG